MSNLFLHQTIRRFQKMNNNLSKFRILVKLSYIQILLFIIIVFNLLMWKVTSIVTTLPRDIDFKWISFNTLPINQLSQTLSNFSFIVMIILIFTSIILSLYIFSMWRRLGSTIRWLFDSLYKTHFLKKYFHKKYVSDEEKEFEEDIQNYFNKLIVTSTGRHIEILIPLPSTHEMKEAVKKRFFSAETDITAEFSNQYTFSNVEKNPKKFISKRGSQKTITKSSGACR